MYLTGLRQRGSAAAGHAGIGLNLSRLIIEAHHGTVDVRNNEDGKGAVIRYRYQDMFLRERLNCKNMCKVSALQYRKCTVWEGI